MNIFYFLGSWINYEKEFFKNNIILVKINEDLVGNIWISGWLFFLNFLINVLFYKFVGLKIIKVLYLNRIFLVLFINKINLKVIIYYCYIIFDIFLFLKIIKEMYFCIFVWKLFFKIYIWLFKILVLFWF